MDASNSSMDFTVEKLAKSIHEEDREIAEKARVTIGKIVESIKPLFRYIGVHICYHPASDLSQCKRDATMFKQMRMIQLSETHNEWPYSLFLTEDGIWHTLFFCPYTPGYSLHYQKDHEYNDLVPTQAWEFFPFNEVVGKLRDVFVAAEEKREKHLAAVRERTKKLDEIMAILERPTEEKTSYRAKGLSIATK